MRAAQEELRSDDPNPTIIGQLQLEALAMRGTVREMEDDFIAEAQAVLTAQQKAALSSLTRIAPYMRHVRQGQSLGLIPNDESEFSLGTGASARGSRSGAGRRDRPNGPNPTFGMGN